MLRLEGWRRKKPQRRKYGQIRGKHNLKFDALPTATANVRSNTILRASIAPHHHTVTESGNYEYFASDGRNPLGNVFAPFSSSLLLSPSPPPRISGEGRQSAVRPATGTTGASAWRVARAGAG